MKEKCSALDLRYDKHAVQPLPPEYQCIIYIYANEGCDGSRLVSDMRECVVEKTFDKHCKHKHRFDGSRRQTIRVNITLGTEYWYCDLVYVVLCARMYPEH